MCVLLGPSLCVRNRRGWYGFSYLLQFLRKVLHLQNERLLYSANLFHMAGSYSWCRYCLLILSVWKYLVFKRLYCTLSMVMSLLWLFFYINVTRILCLFFFSFLKCTLLYIYIFSHDHNSKCVSDQTGPERTMISNVICVKEIIPGWNFALVGQVLFSKYSRIWHRDQEDRRDSKGLGMVIWAYRPQDQGARIEMRWKTKE